MMVPEALDEQQLDGIDRKTLAIRLRELTHPHLSPSIGFP